VSKLEKDRLVRFIAKVMEESGFKVYKDYKTSRHVIDIYGVLPTVLGDMGVVVACKNYDEHWEVGLDVLKEMEMVGKTLQASKVVVVTSSSFTTSASNYAARKNIKLVDKEGIITIAKKFSKKDYGYEDSEGDNPEEYDDEQREVYTSIPPSKKSALFSGGNKSLSKVKSKNISPNVNLSGVIPTIKAILHNTIALIIIVLLLSSLITYIIGIFNKSTAVTGMSKILSSALLAYGLVFLVEKNSNEVLTKGTIVFFVSMIIYVVLIIIM
jgi:hypothetical protein